MSAGSIFVILYMGKDKEEKDKVYCLPRSRIDYQILKNLIEHASLQEKFWVIKEHKINIKEIKNKNLATLLQMNF